MRALARGLALAALFVCAPAMAADPPDRAECARSYEHAQRLRQARSFKAARAELLVCSRSECPGWVRHDCLPWLGDVESKMPSVIVVAQDADGNAASNARISIDGTPVGAHLALDPIALDPGEHVLVLDGPNLARVEQRFTLQEGEHGRRIEFTLVKAEAPVPRGDPPAPPPPPPPARPVPTLVDVLGAAGLAAGGFGAYFQIDGMGKRGDLFGCAPGCAGPDVDDARRTLWTGNVLLGIAALSLVGAALLYVTREQ